MTSAEEKNKALVRRLFKVQEDLQSGKADLNALDELLAHDFVSHYEKLPGQQPDREGYKRVLAELRATRSNVSYLIEDQVAGEDKVVTSLIVRTTDDQGELMGVAPTGREVSGKAILIYRIQKGKIAEEWGLGTMGPKLMRQRLAHELEQERIERERIEQELQVARRIQQASLPKEVPEQEGWQISPFYRPAREVGGDFYDFHLLSEGRVGIVVGDATGKGVPAALVMSTTLGMLQAVSQAFDSSSPGEVLERVNETLIARIPSNMFVTCFYAILDPQSGSLRYANAGHDLPYLRRRLGGDAVELRARGMPLGLMPGMGYEEKEIVCDAGDSVLFYSDGLVEAHDSQRHQMFGSSRLRVLVAGHVEVRSIVELLLEELYSFTGEEWEQEDDITLLTLWRPAL
jgi:serine phosphatase RsbU (regulator of sigma subunit)/ketosteroid isomerase-like protein